MAEFHANTLSLVGEFKGHCVISVNEEALSVLTPHDMTLVAQWLYSDIRRFRADVNDSVFVFESGRRGPFGAQEYQFELVKTDLQQLQSTVTVFTGAHFHTKSPSHSTLDKKNMVDSPSPVVSPSSSPTSVLERVRMLAMCEGVEGDEAEGRSRTRIYTELMETEHTYVSDLSMVIDAYYDAMDPESVSIPLRLRGKRDVVFGNLLDIYKFHDSVFSKALAFFDQCPEKVGECFMQFASEFELYSVYCKNRPRSEVLVNEGTESQAFFKGIQRNLGHHLDLSSFLLKPVQRITKYQLLLKDLVKHSSDTGCALSELEAAYGKMCKILQELNDSMHTAGLKGLPDDLPEPGKLLAHDRFHVSVLEPGPLTFSRSREKHVFLFEKVIVLSKRVESVDTHARRGKKTEGYLYKEHLAMSAVILRERVADNSLVFALELHKQQKEYKFEAQSREVADMWVSEIRRLLQLQFTMLKMQRERSNEGYHTPQVVKRVISADNKHKRSTSCESLSLDTDSDNRRRSAVITEKPEYIKRERADSVPEPTERNSWQSVGCPPPIYPPPPPPPEQPHFEKKPHLNEQPHLDKQSHLNEQPHLEKQPHLNEQPHLEKQPHLNEQPNLEKQPHLNEQPHPYEVPVKSSLPGDSERQQRKTQSPVEEKPHPSKPRIMANGRPLSQEGVSKGGLVVDGDVGVAIESVRSCQQEIAWCVCGYRDNKNQLVVCGEGMGSMDGLKQHLHVDNILFGLLKVVDKLDGIPRSRFVHLQWIGQRSQTMAKVRATTDRSRIAELFQPHHAAIFATAQADLNERIIMDKVARITGTKNHVL